MADVKLSPYEYRLQLVQQAVLTHSDLTDTAAGVLATQILLTLNSIPEKLR